ncbi:MAG: UvrD-helicase domain-containing protein [Mailhella sp.]|nr:UvrD-helicase domain-containing protein [Mailhella sp.]
MRHEFRQIKASAGSGKTYTLTSSFLSLLAEASGASWKKRPAGCGIAASDGSYGWQEILAITFTNKAATEMRERLLSRLKDHALAPASRKRASEEARFWTPTRATTAVDTLIRSYGSLNIRTIDSLLHLMVRLSALDFGLSPDFEPRFSEKDITGPLFDLLAEQARDGNEELAELFRQACLQILFSENFPGFLAGERIRDRVTNMAALMLNADGWSPLKLASASEAEEHLLSLLTDIELTARELLSIIRTEKLKAGKYFLDALNACAFCEGDTNALSDSSTLKKESLDDNLLKASKGAASPSAHELYASLRADMNEMRILLKARRLMPFVELALTVFNKLEEYEQRTGIIAASQVPRLAIRTADDEYGVNEMFCRMGSRISHILIDEFQDTSQDQWMALQPLAEEALARGGSLTIVGDVKQAIYGWRGGDASLFDRLIQQDSPLLHSVGQPALQTLPHNWRSRERIVAWNNALFSPLSDPATASLLLDSLADGQTMLLAEQAMHLSNAFQGAAQSAEHCRPGGYVELRQLEKGTERAELFRQIPPLVEALGKRHSWGRICILVRSNEQASLAASWLMERHIPVVTQGSLLLAEQPVIAELVELLRFINTPEDDLAFWNVLCGRLLLPALTLPDGTRLNPEALADWAARRRLRGTLAQQFSHDFPEVWQSVFAPLLEGTGLLTPYDAAMEVLQRWNVTERCRDAEGFLRRFLEVLFNAEEKGIADLSAFLDFWDENGSQEKAPLPESMDAVRIMTMHKAKGLEFDVVILPWMDFPLGRASDDHAVYWNSRGTSILAPLCREMGEAWLNYRMDSAREALHLVYVAMTRAVSELYCFLASPERGPVPAMLETLIGSQRSALHEEGDISYWGERPEGMDAPALPYDENSDGMDSEHVMVEKHGLEETPVCLPTTPTPSICPPSSPENVPDAPDAGWRPMGWLPRLRMFRSPLEDWTFTARRRGTLIHHCLECLQVSGIGASSARRDAELAAARGLSTFPLPVPNKEEVLADITEDLAWFASQPETAHWLAFGTPEHALLNGDGRQFRVDLLVDDGHELIAVEYKTGTSGELPAPAHTEQLSRYLKLLKDASGQSVRGVLVYLDRRAIFPLSLPDDGGRHA